MRRADPLPPGPCWGSGGSRCRASSLHLSGSTRAGRYGRCDLPRTALPRNLARLPSPAHTPSARRADQGRERNDARFQSRRSPLRGAGRHGSSFPRACRDDAYNCSSGHRPYVKGAREHVGRCRRSSGSDVVELLWCARHPPCPCADRWIGAPAFILPSPAPCPRREHQRGAGGAGGLAPLSPLPQSGAPGLTYTQAGPLRIG